MLEVSSPGAERKLTTPREFTHYIGRDVQVKLYAQLGGKKEFEGKLKGFANDTAEIETEDGVLSIPVKDAVYIRLLFKF